MPKLAHSEVKERLCIGADCRAQTPLEKEPASPEASRSLGFSRCELSKDSSPACPSQPPSGATLRQWPFWAVIHKFSTRPQWGTCLKYPFLPRATSWGFTVFASGSWVSSSSTLLLPFLSQVFQPTDWLHSQLCPAICFPETQTTIAFFLNFIKPVA